MSWQAANDNGRPVTAYTVREYRSASEGGPYTLFSTTSGLPGGDQQSFPVSTNGAWYEYTVFATNAAGTSTESPRSGAVQGVAPPDAPGDLQAFDHDPGSDSGYNNAIHVSFVVPQPNSATLTSVQYGLNAETDSGSFTSPGRPGQSVTESITTDVVNGTNYVVYVRAATTPTSADPGPARPTRSTPTPRRVRPTSAPPRTAPRLHTPGTAEAAAGARSPITTSASTATPARTCRPEARR